MNKQAKLVVRNLLFAFGANMASLVVSIIITLVIPKILNNQEQFAYWQLYVFYSGYVGFFHFGLIDGIYLRIGGKEYADLDKNLFSRKFRLLLVFELLLSSIMIVIFLFITSDANKKNVLVCTCILAVLTILKNFFLYILQATNRIKEYALYTKLDRYLFCTALFIFLISPSDSYKTYIISDLITRLFGLLLCMRCCWDIVQGGIINKFIVIKDMIEDIKIGSKLMLGNIAGTLITGIVRFGIEYSWDIVTFGKISLVLSISNMILSFVSAIGMVMFPILKKINKELLKEIYVNLNILLMLFTFSVLIMFYPAKYLLTVWLPLYKDSFFYMGLLFPICIYECKMSMLILTYLKAERMEKEIFIVNMISLVISVILTFIGTILLRNLILAVLSIVVVLAFRCMLAERALNKKNNISMCTENFFELLIAMGFIIFNLYFNEYKAILSYITLLGTFVIIDRKKIIMAFVFFKTHIKN